MIAFRVLLKANILRRMKDGFAVGYNIIFPLILIGLLGFICKNSFKDEIVTGYQYYGVVMIPFSIFLSIITAAYAGKDDAYSKTADRILIAPISHLTIVCSKIVSETIIFTGCSVLVLFVTSLLWNVCSISNIAGISFLYLSITFFITSVGTYIGLGMKDFMKIKNIINIPILIFAILGGCFFRFGTFDKVTQFVLDLSPLTWINRCCFNYLYDQDSNLLCIICIVLIIIGLLFTFMAVKFFKREEYGYGELPSYEK